MSHSTYQIEHGLYVSKVFFRIETDSRASSVDTARHRLLNHATNFAVDQAACDRIELENT